MPRFEEMTTLQPVEHSANADHERHLTLTILFHPDTARVGQRAHLPANADRFTVSRLAPEFAPPETPSQGPLADPFVSRQPFFIERTADGAVIVPVAGASAVALAEHRLRDRFVVDVSSLERGVVLTVANRVVLLLHDVLAEDDAGDSLGLVGASAGITRVRRDIRRFADHDAPVLVRGETGTGKELVARALHAESRRRADPCVCVNMGAMVPTTALSELFGHARGAFTGAIRDHQGHLERADGGTLFLDEIGETSSDVQSMLLRVLETGDVQPLGSAATRRVDVRLITATDADLELATAQGRFRPPLLHRLAGLVITVPPLRERLDDIARLAIHFLREELAARGELDRLAAPQARDDLWLSPDAMVALVRHGWPGNVRELRNVVRQLVIDGNDARIDAKAVRARLAARMPATPAVAEHAPGSRRAPGELGEDELLAALGAHGFSTSATAVALGISRTTLDAYIARCPRIRKAKDIPREELERSMVASAGDITRAAAALAVSKRALQHRLTELGLARSDGAAKHT